MKKPNIAVLIPAYNAVQDLPGVIRRVPRTVAGRIIVVDDGSTDGTVAAVEKLKDKRVLLIRHGKNKGYGAAQKTLFAKAKAMKFDATVILHSDGQHDPSEMTRLLEPILAGKADVVLGARRQVYKGGMPFYKIIGNISLTILENLAFGMSLSTFHSGYRACNRKTLDVMDLSGFTNDFHFDSEFLLHAFRNGLRLIEVPVRTIYGTTRSNVNVVKYGFDILGLVFSQLRYRVAHPFASRKKNQA